MEIANVIIALDMNRSLEVKKFVSKFNKPTWFKLGMELIYAEGFEIINYIKKRGHKVFLDLKMIDIPNTIKNAIKSISKYNVDMVTIHASGGLEMMNEARKSNPKLKILAVTVLTSITQKILNKELNIKHTIDDYVQHLAKLAKKANLYGVICSSQEAHHLKDLGLKIVTPGIRREVDNTNDQKRVTTPLEAKKNGANFIVVGRPITSSKDPIKTYNNFVEEFNNG